MLLKNCNPVIEFYQNNSFVKFTTLKNNEDSIKMIYKI